MDTNDSQTLNNKSSPFNNRELNTDPNVVHSQSSHIPGHNPYEDYKGPVNYGADNTNGFDLVTPINTTTPNNVVEGPKTQDKNAPSYLKDANQRKGSDNFDYLKDKEPVNQVNTSPFSKHIDSSLSDQVFIGDDFKTDGHLDNLVPDELAFPSHNNAPRDKADAFDFGVIEDSPGYMPDENSDHETLHDRLDNLENEIKNMYPEVSDRLINRPGVENDEPLNTKLDT